MLLLLLLIGIYSCVLYNGLQRLLKLWIYDLSVKHKHGFARLQHLLNDHSMRVGDNHLLKLAQIYLNLNGEISLIFAFLFDVVRVEREGSVLG